MALLKRTPGEKVFNVINYLVMIVLCIVCLYPLWYVLVASLSDPVQMYANRGILLWPLQPMTTKGYTLVFEDPNIPRSFLNTLIYLGVGTLLNMFVTCMGAYGLSRKGLFWNGKVMKLIAFTMYFSGGLIPFYLMVQQMNLLDSIDARDHEKAGTRLPFLRPIRLPSPANRQRSPATAAAAPQRL